MAVRVTGAEVLEIINSTLSASEIAPFITAANLTVTAKLTGKGLSSNQLKEIERWLTAHLVYIRDPKLVEEEIDETRDKNNIPKMDMGLNGTPYGQQVLVLDTSGTMANLGKRPAKIEAIYDSSSSSSS